MCTKNSVQAWVLSHFSHVSATLWTAALQAPLSMGFSKQEYWSGLSCPSAGDFSDRGIKLLHLLRWQIGSLPLALPGKPKNNNCSTACKSRNKLEKKKEKNPTYHLGGGVGSKTNNTIEYYIILFISLYLIWWLCWVFFTAHGPSPVVVSHPLVRVHRLLVAVVAVLAEHRL